MAERLDNTSGLRERTALWLSILAAIGMVAGGFYLSAKLTDPHWMNRAGAAIVTLQAFAAAVEFSRRNRLHALAQGYPTVQGRTTGSMSVATRPRAADMEKRLEKEISNAERRAFLTVIVLAMVGELLHGFGDLLYEFLAH